MLIRFLSIRKERLVNLRDSEPTELLCSSYKGDVTDHLKGTKDTRRLRIGNIGHTKVTLKNSSHVKETTVDGSKDHVSKVMDVILTDLSSLFLFLSKVELLIQLLSQIALNEGAFGRHKGTIEVGVFLVSQKEDSVCLILNSFESLSVGVLIVSKLLIRFSDLRCVLTKSFNDNSV